MRRFGWIAVAVIALSGVGAGAARATDVPPTPKHESQVMAEGGCAFWDASSNSDADGESAGFCFWKAQDGSGAYADRYIWHPNTETWEHYSSDVDPSDIAIDYAAGTAHIDAVIDGCRAVVDFAAAGPEEVYDGGAGGQWFLQPHVLDDADNVGADFGNDRYATYDKPTSASGDVCGWALSQTTTTSSGIWQERHERDYMRVGA